MSTRPDPIVAKIIHRSPEGAALRAALLQAFENVGAPLTLQALFEWKKLKGGVPPRRVHIVSQIMDIPASLIRPDLFSNHVRPAIPAPASIPVKRKKWRKKKRARAAITVGA